MDNFDIIWWVLVISIVIGIQILIIKKIHTAKKKLLTENEILTSYAKQIYDVIIEKISSDANLIEVNNHYKIFNIRNLRLCEDTYTLWKSLVRLAIYVICMVLLCDVNKLSTGFWAGFFGMGSIQILLYLNDELRYNISRKKTFIINMYRYASVINANVNKLIIPEDLIKLENDMSTDDLTSYVQNVLYFAKEPVVMNKNKQEKKE